MCSKIRLALVKGWLNRFDEARVTMAKVGARVSLTAAWAALSGVCLSHRQGSSKLSSRVSALEAKALTVNAKYSV